MQLTQRHALTLAGVLFATWAIAAPALAHPGSGIVVDKNGQVYFVDTGQGVWKMDAQDRLVRHDGPPFHWLALDESSQLRKTRLPRSSSADVRAVGANPTLMLSSDFPLTVGRDNALYYPELNRDQRVEIVRLTPSGARSVAATLPASTGSGPLRWLNGMATGPDGSIYYTENKAVRRITQGEIVTLADDVSVTECSRPPGYPDDSLGPHLRGLAVGSDGTVFVAATGCGALLKIADGKVTPVVRMSAPWSPTGVAVAGTTAYVLEFLHTHGERHEWTPRIRKVAADGRDSVVATVTRQ